MSDEEQFEPARPRRVRRPTPPWQLLAIGLGLLVAGVAWSAGVVALWSTDPERMATHGPALVGCALASLACYVIGLASLLAWKNRRR